jgi:hypothetical protein
MPAARGGHVSRLDDPADAAGLVAFPLPVEGSETF